MSRSLARFVFIATALFFICFFLIPIWTTLREAFISTQGGFTLEYIAEVFRNPVYREGLLNSLIMAVGSTAGCFIVAVPLAVVFTCYQFPGKSLLNSLILIPMILPPFVGAIGIKAMLGQAGSFNSFLITLGVMSPDAPIDWLGNGKMVGIILMNVLHLYPILYLNVVATLANLDPALEEAAANLGCSPQRRFWRITVPMIMPGIFAGGSIVFIWAFTELGVPLIFDYRMVTSVQIFDTIRDLSDNPFPYALVVVLLIATTLMYMTSKWLFGNSHALGGGRATTGREEIPLIPYQAWLCTALFVLCIFAAVLPHVGVVFLSVSSDWYHTIFPTGLTLSHYQDALSHELTLSAIANSLRYAGFATLLDLLLGVAIAYVNVRTNLRGRQWLDTMAMLPLAVPGLVLAFGYLAMSREGQIFSWLMLGEDPVLLLVIAYSVRRLPYVVRSATAGFQQVNPTLDEAAQNLGCPPLKALFKITLPLIVPNLVAGCLLAFAFAMLEVSDSMILAQQAGHYPITKAIYSLTTSLGDGPLLASALGVWAMIFLAVTLTGAGLLLGKKLGSLFRV